MFLATKFFTARGPSQRKRSLSEEGIPPKVNHSRASHPKARHLQAMRPQPQKASPSKASPRKAFLCKACIKRLIIINMSQISSGALRLILIYKLCNFNCHFVSFHIFHFLIKPYSKLMYISYSVTPWLSFE